jgi:hypothetical protein
MKDLEILSINARKRQLIQSRAGRPFKACLSTNETEHEALAFLKDNDTQYVLREEIITDTKYDFE